MAHPAPEGEEPGPPYGGGLERDLLARRRAQRSGESGGDAFARRAAAAEATVETLERHVASLQRRLRELEDENDRLGEGLEDARANAREREHELRRVRQREQAEQQLRVEAETRLVGGLARELDYGGGLAARLAAGEAAGRELAARLAALERELAVLRQGAGVERDALAGTVQALEGRVATLEERARAAELELAGERAERAHAESALRELRQQGASAARIVGELREIAFRLAATLPRAASAPAASAEAGGEELAAALKAASERLRARAAEPPATETRAAPPRPAHKHSTSLIGRWRARRKERRAA